MIHASVNTWLYHRMLDLPAYRYVDFYRWNGRTIVIFARDLTSLHRSA